MNKPIIVMDSDYCQCRTKTSETIIDAVKFEVFKLDSPQHIKIYFQNNNGFQIVENYLLEAVLKEKYKSDIEFESQQMNKSKNTSRKPVRFAKVISCKLTDTPCKYNRLDISILSNISSIDRSTDVKAPEVSLVNMSTNTNPTPEKTQNTTADDSNEISSSQSSPPNPTSRLQTTSHESSSRISDDSGRKYSDSFIQRLKEREAHQREDCVENRCLEKENAEKYTKMLREENMPMNVDSDEDIEQDEPKLHQNCNSKTSSSKSNSQRQLGSDKTHQIQNKFLNEEGISNEHNFQLKETQKSSTAGARVARKRLYSSQNNEGLMLSSQDDVLSVGVPSNKVETKTKPPSTAGARVARKRLYSSQNNEGLMLSSQDDVLSVGVPSNKVETKTKPPSKMDRKNVSFSYINYKEKKSMSIKKENVSPLLADDVGENVSTEVSDEDREIIEAKPKKKVSIKNQEKHIKSLKNEKESNTSNKTPEKVKSCNNFPTRSIYSDFSSGEKIPNAKKTYGRQKPKRGKKRTCYMSSSSDPDPDTKVSPQVIQTHGRKRQNEIVKKPVGFAKRMEKAKIDPTRGCVPNKSRKMEVDQIPFEETIETRVIYQQEVIKGPKRGKSKATRQATKNKNPPKEARKACDEDSEDLSEDEKMDFEAGMDIVPCEAKESEPEDEWALDVFSNPPSQDRKLLQATYKINDMVQVGKSCTLQVKTRLNKVHSLAQKEREMNIATFDYNVQSSISSMQTSFQKLEAASKILAKTKMALDSTHNLLRETTVQLGVEASRIEKAQKELKRNLAQAEKTESSSITSIFQGFSRYMRNVVLTLVQTNQKEK